MEKKKILVLLSLFCVFFSCVLITATSAEQKSKKTKNSSPRATTKVLKETSKFATIPFNIAADKLTPQYLGHDAEQLYLKIKEKQANEEKGEFETTEQYKKRLQMEDSLPIFGTLMFDSIFAVKIFGIDSLYNADKKELKIAIKLSKVKNEAEYDESRRAVIAKSDHRELTYKGTNAFGATVDVKEDVFTNYNIAFVNYEEFPLEVYTDPNMFPSDPKSANRFRDIKWLATKESVVIKLRIEPERARAAKENLEVLMVCSLEGPFITKGGTHRKPKFSDPSAFSSLDYYINARLLELWYYDFKTGEVFKKINIAQMKAERESKEIEESSKKK